MRNGVVNTKYTKNSAYFTPNDVYDCCLIDRLIDRIDYFHLNGWLMAAVAAEVDDS